MINLFQVIGSLEPGGAERLVVNLLLHHDRTRYQPFCICLRDPQNSHYEQILHQHNIPIYFLGKKGDQMDWATYRRLAELFREYRPQVVHTHLGGLSYAYPLMIRYRTPVRVHTIHSVAHKDLPLRGVGRLAWVLSFRYRVGGVVPVAIAEEVQRTIEQVYGYKQAPLIPNGIPTHEYAPDTEKRLCWRQANRIEAEAIVVVSVGRLVPSKNHALMLNAFSRVRSASPLYLLLVGGGELEDMVRKQIEELGLAARVRMLGVRADIPDVLNASDVFVLSSEWEGNPMSVQEAMASGLPVVSTAVGGVPELLQDGVSGLLVPSGDEQALAHALQRLVDDAPLRQQMGAAGLARARANFDITNTVRMYEALYERIMKGKRLLSPSQQ